jgi:predicted metalloendopeptidase
MALETRIAEHHWDRTRNRDRDATYNRMTLAELQREPRPASTGRRTSPASASKA